MKKLAMALIMMLSVIGVACADTYAHDDSVLPAAAKAVLKKNFKAGVSVVKIDKDFGMVKDYEVVLTDGTEIEFDSKGNWEKVETAANVSVPQGFVIKPISDFVNKNHKGAKIVGIENNRNDYEVTLSNGVEIKFTKQGAFKKYD